MPSPSPEQKVADLQQQIEVSRDLSTSLAHDEAEDAARNRAPVVRAGQRDGIASPLMRITKETRR
jgi:hypothetical protein